MYFTREYYVHNSCCVMEFFLSAILGFTRASPAAGLLSMYHFANVLQPACRRAGRWQGSACNEPPWSTHLSFKIHYHCCIIRNISNEMFIFTNQWDFPYALCGLLVISIMILSADNLSEYSKFDSFKIASNIPCLLDTYIIHPVALHKLQKRSQKWASCTFIYLSF